MRMQLPWREYVAERGIQLNPAKVLNFISKSVRVRALRMGYNTTHSESWTRGAHELRATRISGFQLLPGRVSLSLLFPGPICVSPCEPSVHDRLYSSHRVVLSARQISDDDRMSLTTAVSDDDDGESAHNSPYRAKQTGTAAASFNCTGAVRKAG